MYSRDNIAKDWSQRLVKRGTCFTGLFAALAQLPVPAAAETPQGVYPGSVSSQSPEVELPKPIMAEVARPGSATTEPRVVLLLELDETGHVVAANAIEGEEPFIAIALEAAQQFRFEPARRRGRPTRCRFRYLVPWRAPSADLGDASKSTDLPRSLGRENRETDKPAKSVGRPLTAKPPRATRAPRRTRDAAVLGEGTGAVAPLEVSVQGLRLAPGAQSLTASEAREMPGSLGDPLRAVDALPGVTPVMSGLPYFYVRGAPPGNVGYFIDGVQVPMLWHAVVGPSVIHPDMLSKVTLYRGAAPAEYGRYAGAVVTADTLTVVPEQRNEAGLRLIDASLMTQVPLGGLRQGIGEANAAVAGRYSYTGLVLSGISKDIELGYWDYQTLVTVPISKQSSIGFLGLGAYDHLATKSSRSSIQYHRGDVRFDHRIGRGSGLHVAITVGHDDTAGERGQASSDLVASRVQIMNRICRELQVKAGGDITLNRFGVSVEESMRYQTAVALGTLLPSRMETAAGAYAALDYFPTSGIQVSPGIRADAFATMGKVATAIDPRIAARYVVSRRFALEHNVGISHQASVLVPGVPAAQVMSLNQGLQKSISASSGFRYDITDVTQANLAVFESVFQNLSDPLGTTQRFSFDTETGSRRVQGAAYGAEVYLRRKMDKRIGGFISYTLAHSTRSYGSISTLASTDRTHVLNSAVALDLGRHVRVGARVSLMSGLPTRRATNAGETYLGSNRAAPYLRIDLRAEKRWVWSERNWISLVLELMNATFAQEVTGRSCNPVRCTESRLGPIVLPSIGVEAHF